LRRAGTADGKVFTTQREAIASARKHFASTPGQIVIHSTDGKIREALYYKLPKIQSPPKSLRFNRKKIEKAVASIVLDPQGSRAN
jgi:uncharacterized protein DUF2188